MDDVNLLGNQNETAVEAKREASVSPPPQEPAIPFALDNNEGTGLGLGGNGQQFAGSPIAFTSPIANTQAQWPGAPPATLTEPIAITTGASFPVPAAFAMSGSPPQQQFIPPSTYPMSTSTTPQPFISSGAATPQLSQQPSFSQPMSPPMAAQTSCSPQLQPQPSQPQFPMQPPQITPQQSYPQVPYTQPTTFSPAVPAPGTPQNFISQQQTTIYPYAHILRKWIDPSIFTDIPLTDPFGDLITQTFPTERIRSELPIPELEKLSHVPQMQTTLSALISQQRWRHVGVLTRRLLVSCNPNPGPQEVEEIMRYWYLRLLSLLKLKHFQNAQVEIDRLGDLDSRDLKYETHEIPSKTGNMVTLELRVLKAQMPLFRGDFTGTVNNLTSVVYEIRRMRRKYRLLGKDSLADQMRENEMRVLLCVANAFCGMNEWESAIRVLKTVAETWKTKELLRMGVLSGLGRVYLQIGNVVDAEKVFKEVEELERMEREKGTVNGLNRTLLNTAFLALAQPTPSYDSASSSFAEHYKGTQSPLSLNNLAVSQLYYGFAGKVRFALPVLPNHLTLY